MSPSFLVSGRVYSGDRGGVAGLRVQLVDKNAGPDVLLAEGSTDNPGGFSFTYSPAAVHKPAPDIQVRVFAGDVFVGASEVRYNATETETLDVVLLPAAAAALPSEHAALTASMAAHYTGKLRDLKESEDRSDITYLANKTGWDARAVALASLADQFSAATTPPSGGEPAIAPELFYALFRAGLPANEDTIFRADPAMVAELWKQAAGQGIIPTAVADAIPAATRHFERLGAQRLLTAPPAAGVSPLGQVLASSRLTADQQAQFAALQLRSGNDPAAFWQAVTSSFGPDVVARLQVDGKLAFLTMNNAPLMDAVRNANGGDAFKDPRQLAHAGFHRPERWRELLGTAVPIPPQIPGSTPDEQRTNYAAVLAAQVRVSYPTAAVAEMVKSGTVAVAAPDKVHEFLAAHDGTFEIGAQPVERYVAENHVDAAPEVIDQVKRLQRVYQITSGDAAMVALLQRGFDSAYSVARMDRDAFVRNHAEHVGGAEQAARIHAKAAQVHNFALNIATSYLTAANAVPLGASPLVTAGGDAGGAVLRPAPGEAAAAAPGVIAYPTLEALAGSMDFCACDHCRSILSPAAYLVDLLHFIDREPTTAEAAARAGNPQAVLLERRPDIQHLPLTCENTNTALPYIDLVNETLEYFVASGAAPMSLAGFVGHDTKGVPSEDLLASPQFVMEAAYTTLADARFPPPLPFNRPLALMRRLLAAFDIPLSLAMERLRKTDALERGSEAYGWRDILMEELGISREEHEILTDSGAVPLWRMYGFSSGTADADVVSQLVNAKTSSRRIGVSYEELVAILSTRFVNPNSDLVPRLNRLGVSFRTLRDFHDGTIPELPLPTGAAAPDPADYGGDIAAWVKQPDNFARIMSIVTLTDPSGGDTCDFGALELRYSRPAADPSDTSTRIGAVEFVRLLRFIRLWKKTGWTIEEADAAICALYRADASPLTASDVDEVAKLDQGFRTFLPRLGMVFRILRGLGPASRRELLSLLACCAQDGAVANTVVERPAWLARMLRLSALELTALVSATGLNPFGPPDPPRPGMTRLIELIEATRARSLKPAAALSMIWNQQVTDKPSRDAERAPDLARLLRADFSAIDEQFAGSDEADEQELARRKRLQAVQRLAGATGADVAFVQAILDPLSAPYPLHAIGDTGRPALDDVMVVASGGLEARFFFQDSASGSPDVVEAGAATLDYSPARQPALPANPNAGAAISAMWVGRIEFPERGSCTFFVLADAGAAVTLKVNGEPRALTNDSGTWRTTEAIEASPGTLYEIEITVSKVKDRVSIQWETAKRRREVVPARYLYPPALTDRFRDVYLRFVKSASLASRLKLSTRELVRFAVDPVYRVANDGWLNALPVSGGAAPAVAAALLEPFAALLEFSRIKADLSADQDQLVDILGNPAASTATPDSALFILTRWDADSVNAVLAHFGEVVAGLGRFDVFRRVYGVFEIIRALGVPASALIPVATNDPSPPNGDAFEAALQARYAPRDRREFIRPVNDDMRSQQRDALVAFVLQGMHANPATAHIDTADKLFEYFLMDVQMEPCMLTSRVRHALSSVQLFVERCLMNLEQPAVSATSIDAARWAWMKRYRVWEANRKVFIWPENWLEPELRDDKSSIFKELESELLQSDITADAAAVALLNYLAKLEELAKLEPCGIHYLEPTGGRGETIHVVARTAGAHRKYYHRRYEFGSWTPWDPIKLDIEDNPVIPVVWNDRLLLFWLRILKEPPPSNRPRAGKPLGQLTTSDLPDPGGVTPHAVLCWSEYYNGKWQAAKTSDLEKPTSLPPFGGEAGRSRLRLGVRSEADALRVYAMDGPTRFWSRGRDGQLHLMEFWPGSFLVYNTHSLPVRGEDDVRPSPSSTPPAAGPHRDLVGTGPELAFAYSDGAGSTVTRQVLDPELPFDIVIPRHELRNALDAPFLMADSRHAFLVSTTQRPVWIRTFEGYGIFPGAGVLSADIPALVAPPPPKTGSTIWGEGGASGTSGVLADAATVRAFVTEDAYIRHGLPTTRNVEFEGKVIGPSGALPSR